MEFQLTGTKVISHDRGLGSLQVEAERPNDRSVASNDGVAGAVQVAKEAREAHHPGVAGVEASGLKSQEEGV